MTPGGIKNDATERNDKNVTRIDRRMADNANQDHHRCQQPFGGDTEQRPQAGIDESRVLCHTDTEHGDEHDAHGVKVREIRHHHREELGHRLPGEQVVDDQRLLGARVDDRETDVG